VTYAITHKVPELDGVMWWSSWTGSPSGGTGAPS